MTGSTIPNRTTPTTRADRAPAGGSASLFRVGCLGRRFQVGSWSCARRRAESGSAPRTGSSSVRRELRCHLGRERRRRGGAHAEAALSRVRSGPTPGRRVLRLT